ncbi:MAG: magnesium transporter MgtE N-terminal domain-containing protein [Panacagrimonas sp.]
MAEGLALASGFVELEPEAAARALEELPSEQAALFLAELPPKLAGPLISHMASGSAARRLALLPSKQAGAFLEEVGGRDCVAILRVCAPEPRRAILSELPPRLVQHFRRSLAYTLDAVGAWVDYDVAAMSGHRKVAEALQMLRQRGQREENIVFVLRASQHYAGVVMLPALLHAPADATLASIADRSIRALSDALDVDEVQNLDDWDRSVVLPVTAPDGNFLGGLSRASMRRALHSVFPQPAATQPQSLIAHLFTAYLHTGADVLRLMIGRGLSLSAGKGREEP